MKNQRHNVAFWRQKRLAATLFVTLAAGFANAQEPIDEAAAQLLGPAPRFDPDKAPLTFSATQKAVVPVPAIDTASKAAVRTAYNTYYNVAQPALGFSGSVAGCNPGSISLAFQEWTISRINYLRAMAGVPGNTTLDSAYNAQEQAASLIMLANNTLTHYPSADMLCYSALGATGAGQSNLALGVTDSIPLYMSEPGSGNELVGHRRWVLHSAKTRFGHGQADAASALWAFDMSGSAVAPAGIPWPPRGYVPLSIFPTQFVSAQRWSFGLPNANFGSANVALALNGAAVPVTVISRTDNGYGDNTIVWQLPAGHTVAKNTVYDVTITGVGGAASSTYAYQVRPFDPADPLGGARTDINADGMSDLLWRNQNTGQIYRLSMNAFALAGGNLVYTEPDTNWKIVGDGDFNGDGLVEVLFRNSATGQVSIMPLGSNGIPTGGATVVSEPDQAWKIVQTTDIDGDGKTDLVWWNSTTGQVYVMLMNGSVVTAGRHIWQEPNVAWKIVASGDFAGNGRGNQLLWRNSTTGQVFLMTVTSALTASGSVIYQEANTAWKIVAAADFDGNGRTDILWRNSTTGQVYMMLMNGAAISSAGFVWTEPNTAWKIVATGDYDGDQRADILWRNDATGQVYMMRMNGRTVTSAAMVYTEGDTAWRIMGAWEYGQATGSLQ